MFVSDSGGSYECRYKFSNESIFSVSATNNGSGVFTCASPSEDQLLPIVRANRGKGRGGLREEGRFKEGQKSKVGLRDED